VRGFSPTSAGNVRIDGLYFDPVWSPNARIRRSSTIRVGLSAQGFAFPAPTGIVDYALRRPGNEASASVFVSTDSYANLALEMDGVLPLTGTLSVGGGVGLYRNRFYNGTGGNQHLEGVTALWRPKPEIEIQPFWSRSDIYDDEFGPTYVPGGAFLPPRVPRRRFLGPGHPKYRSTASLYGTLARYDFAEDWRIRAGLFRTYFDDRRVATNLLLNLTPEGAARQVFIVDAPSLLSSTSGEVRLTRRLAEGPRLHALHLNLRARDRRDRYGGSAVIDLGQTDVDRPVPSLGEDFTFSEQSRDRVRQWTAGIAYEGRWRGIGELSLGLQRTDYRKRVTQPGRPLAATDASPWLYNIAAAAYLTGNLALYGGYTRGLEESGVAPDNAANRNEALPAIRTSQRDAGLRRTVRPGLRLVVGLFDVRKPYFNLDEANVFTLLGDVKHQGIEASIAGRLTPRLDIVAGGVLLHARVTGEGVELGRVGRRPLGQAARNLQLNLDWRPPILEGLSLDLGITHLSARAATRDNLVELPARTLVDIGARYRFNLGGKSASLRLRATNLFDVYGFDLRGSGAYDLIPGRVFSGSLAFDF
jgi:iron complex outermembrane receptor protein